MNMYRPQPRRGEFFLGSSLSSAVRMLLVWNVILFLLQQLVDRRLEFYLGLVPAQVWNGYLWQLVTYMFLHGSFMHILFNMFALWMFGSELENLWGTARFVKYYFFTGIGAGISTVLVTPNAFTPTIGASGAIYGLLLAYGMTFPDRQILLYFLFPIKAKYFVILFGVLELFASVTSQGSGIAHVAHLGGLVFGWVYLKTGLGGGGGIGRSFRQWQRRRQMRKFKVLDFPGQDGRR